MDEERAPLAEPDEVEYVSGEVDKVVKQAQDIYCRKNRSIMKTHFYKVVLAGNVQVIANALKYMDENNLKHIKDWLLRTDLKDQSHKRKQADKMKQIVAFILTFIFVCVTTPVFYIVHYILNVILNRRQKRISKNIELPLVFAVFSQKQKMLSYFLSSGFDLYERDSAGNNLFHYIADLSSTTPTKAIDIFDTVIKSVPDIDEGRKLLQEMKNTSGLTAIEYTVKYGSPALFSHILTYPQLISQTEFEANASSVVYGNSRKEIRESLDDKTSVEYVDVSMYEIGSLRNQSKLLNLLSDRNVLEMTRSDLSIFHQTALVGKWISLKVKQMFGGILMFHLLDMVPTALLLIIVSSPFLENLRVSFDSLTRWKVFNEEMNALADGKSSLFKADRYEDILHKAFAEHQFKYVKNYVTGDPEVEDKIIEKINRSYPEYVSDTKKILAFEEYDVAEKFHVYQKILEVSLTVDELEDKYPFIYGSYILPDIFKNLTSVFVHYMASMDMKLSRRTVELYDWGLVRIIQDYEVFYGNKSTYLDTFLKLWEYRNLVCIKEYNFNQDDLQLKETFHLPSEVFIVDACHLKSLQTMSKEKCIYTPVTEIVKQESQKYERNQYANYLLLAHGLLSTVYFIIDLVERCVFIYISIAGQKRFKDIFITFFSCKVPGSYSRKQVNLLTHGVMLLVLVAVILYSQLIVQLDTTYTNLTTIIKYIISTNLIFRLIMHIHAMRLLPGIGHFVITTFLMGTNLIHFSIVFGIVIIIFAVMFELLIYNPECPYENAVGFETFQESLFSTFRLTFGHGDLSPFFTNTPAMFTYVLYMIMVGLLALNLIIAIMSTTAMDVMSEPWKQRLWDIEWLDEATSVEFTMSVLGMSCRRCCHRKVGILDKSGYVVKKRGGKNKVFIELFHTTALDITE